MLIFWIIGCIFAGLVCLGIHISPELFEILFYYNLYFIKMVLVYCNITYYWYQ